MLYLYLMLMTGPSFLSAAFQQFSLPEFVQLIFLNFSTDMSRAVKGLKFYLVCKLACHNVKDADPRCEPSRQGALLLTAQSAA